MYLDFDGDGVPDLTAWDYSNGVFHIQFSNNGAQLHLSADKFVPPGDTIYPVPGHWRGADKPAGMVWYLPKEGRWVFVDLANNTVRETTFGYEGTRPVSCDIDSDGRADLGVFDERTAVRHHFSEATGYHGLGSLGNLRMQIIPGWEGYKRPRIEEHPISEIYLWKPKSESAKSDLLLIMQRGHKPLYGVENVQVWVDLAEEPSDLDMIGPAAPEAVVVNSEYTGDFGSWPKWHTGLNHGSMATERGPAWVKVLWVSGNIDWYGPVPDGAQRYGQKA